MKKSVLLVFLILISGLSLLPGAARPHRRTAVQGNRDNGTPALQGSVGKITPADLTVMVKEAVAYAKENGKEKAIAAFNDPNGSFVKNGSMSLPRPMTVLHLPNPSSTISWVPISGT